MAGTDVPGPSAGDGVGSGGEGAEVVDEPGSALRKCLNRFDDVALEPDASWSRMHKRGAHDVWVTVATAAQERFDRGELPAKRGDDRRRSERALEKGYVAALFDEPRDRVVIVLDPKVVDLDDAERDLDRVAQRAQEKEPVKGNPFRVEVFASCTSAERLLEIDEELSRDWRELDLSTKSGPQLDGRFEVGTRTEEGKREIERRYGDLVEVGISDVRPM